MNPFLPDRDRPGEPSLEELQKTAREQLFSAVRDAVDPETGPGAGSAVLVKAARAGMGKTHLLACLAAELGASARVTAVTLRPENLGDWETSWRDRLGTVNGPGVPRVFIFDHLDAFLGEPRAGIRIAALVDRFVTACAGSIALVAANDDLWESLFETGLPSALRDLLTGEVVEMPPLSAGEAEGLLIHRMEQAGFEDHVILRFLETLDLRGEETRRGGDGLSPREALRLARRTWRDFVGEEAGLGRDLGRRTVPFPGATGTTEVPGAQAKPEPWAAAEQARTHLNAVADALRRQAAPRRSAEPLRVLETPETPPQTLIEEDAQAPPRRGDVPSLAERFHEVRTDHLQRERVPYRPEILYGLFRRVGKRFPSVEQRIVGVERPVRERLLEWKLFGRRIWIGVAPFQDRETWERTLADWKEAVGPAERAKLVGFSPPREEESIEAPPEGVDEVALDRDLLASLYAAEELLRCRQTLVPDFREASLASFTASELDYFWSRLTRMAGAAPEMRVS